MRVMCVRVGATSFYGTLIKFPPNRPSLVTQNASKYWIRPLRQLGNIYKLDPTECPAERDSGVSAGGVMKKAFLFSNQLVLNLT